VEQRTGRSPGVLVIADHGESLFDEGFLGHGYAANDAQTRIPFIASGLPVRIPVPVGQLDVRRLLRAALTNSPGRPSVDTEGTGAVFQYIGTFGRPKEIALAAAEERRRLQLMGPRPPGPLRPEELELVHFWERASASLPSASR
jgi:hypothetical protein